MSNKANIKTKREVGDVGYCKWYIGNGNFIICKCRIEKVTPAISTPNETYKTIIILPNRYKGCVSYLEENTFYETADAALASMPDDEE